MGLKKGSVLVTLRGMLATEGGRHLAALQDVVAQGKLRQVFTSWQPKSHSALVAQGLFGSSLHTPPQSPSIEHAIPSSCEHLPPHSRSAMQNAPALGLSGSHWPHWMSSSQTALGSLLQEPMPKFPHWASTTQVTLGSSEHCPGSKLARPRRSMVLRIEAPNWEKSQLRPSRPPSGWQLMQAT